MTDNLMTGVVSVALAIIGVATLAVILSKNSQTSSVIQAGSSALANNILAATGPITNAGGFGGGQVNTQFPTSSGY